MRILLTTDAVGGVWTYTKELAVGLLDQSHTVALVSIGPPPQPAQLAWCDLTASRFGANFSFSTCSAPLEWMPENTLAYDGAVAHLQQLADAFEPEIFLSSQFCFGRLPLPIPRIVVAHSDVLSWARACKPRGLEPSPWLSQYLDLVERGLAAADIVVAPTYWMLNELARSFDLPAHRTVIANGRSLPAQVSAAPARDRSAVSAGRLWDPAKNSKIFEQIRTDVAVLLAGAASSDSFFRPSSPSVRHLGPLDEHDLHALFARSSVYVLASLYEPFGLAALEAALCGCAILANDTSAAREVWEDGAIYFEGPQQLEHKLASLFADSDVLRNAQAASQARAQHFTTARMTDSYLDLFVTATSSSERQPEAHLVP